MKIEYSCFQKRLCCDECDWWSRPVLGGYLYLPDGFPRDVCPSCGSNQVHKKTGRMVKEIKVRGRWPFRFKDYHYVAFQLRTDNPGGNP
jgi:hypothetical protein